jgi:predicted oxidoreductase
MRTLEIGKSGMMGSVIALGCMRISKLEAHAVDAWLATGVESGYNFYDHADIYAGGRSEVVFGAALKRSSIRREDVLLQSKCGIRKGLFDFSKEHILASVEGSLGRLGTDHLDVLMLHRPDTLMEPGEVAAAFSQLHRDGKVRHFAVSNMNPGQMELLRRHVEQPLVANQMQLSLCHTSLIDAGFNVNMGIDPAIVRDGGTLEYCRLHDITLQAWSPFQYGFFDGVFLGSDQFPALNQVIDEMALVKEVSASAMAIAWLLRHPAGIQPVIGSTDPQRVREIAKAADVELTREEWYRLYLAAGNRLP